jgi:hypothetical protein
VTEGSGFPISVGPVEALHRPNAEEQAAREHYRSEDEHRALLLAEGRKQAENENGVDGNGGRHDEE